ncbi:MAG TPA: hypothetical protein VGH15_05395 [Caulobacteraceae bacterium]
MKLPAIAVTAIAIAALVGGTAAAQVTMQPVPNPPGPATTPMGHHHHGRHWRHHHHHMRHHRHMHHHMHHHMGAGPAPAEPAPAPEAPAPTTPPSM